MQIIRKHPSLHYRQPRFPRFAAGILSSALLLGGCGSAADGAGATTDIDASDGSESSASGATDTTDATDATAAGSGGGADTASASDASSSATTPISYGEADPSTMTSRDLAFYLGNGINLGNTMEATDNTDFSHHDISHWETLWGQPLTTQEMIDDMAAAGLTTVRIPVAWTNNMDFLNGDYTIDPALLARVKEIVDYCYNDQLYVVLNDHWDRGWWGMYGSADAAQRDAAMTLYTTMWTQIADYFQDYDYHLIFEGGNEEIGDRLNDITAGINPQGAVLSKDECYTKANEINQTFVDLIRASGGYNPQRYLLIPGYGTDITQTLDPRWHMPTDPAGDKLFLSVHYYTPWNYCGGNGSSTWGTIKNYEEMNGYLEDLYEAYGKDYGVIIGECGVLPTSAGTLKPNALLWFTNFYANCDLYGFVPLLWNTGDFLNKTSHQWIDDDLRDFFIANSYAAQAGMSADAISVAALQTIQDGLAAAPETFQTDAILSGDGSAVAWIMWNSQDWSIGYSVGDTYNPDDITDGLVPTAVTIEGEGSYTIALDFTGTWQGYSTSTAFSAIGISNGEELFPGYVITITDVLINGEPYQLHGRNYTSSDDGLCTRSNLYNEWVPSVPEDARTRGGGITGCSPTILHQDDLGDVYTIEITFDYTPGAQGVSPNDVNCTS